MFSRKPARKRKRRSNNRINRLEALETRQLMAGDIGIVTDNVTAAFEGNNLVIEGNHLDNEIKVSQDGFGNLTVQGLNGTTINGNNTPTVFLGGDGWIDGDVIINMGSGDDKVTVQGLQISGDLSIFGHTGEDFVMVTQTTVGDNALVHGGWDADQLYVFNSQIGSVFTEGLTVVAGNGDNTVLVAGTETAGLMSITAGDGDDTIYTSLSGSNAGMLSINARDGVNRVQMHDSHGNSLNILGGDHEDVVWLDGFETSNPGLTVADINIETGGSDDLIAMHTEEIGDLMVDSGIGHDTVIASFHAEDVVFSLGGGNDHLMVGAGYSTAESLTINTAAGHDDVLMWNIDVTGSTVIVLHAGNDTLKAMGWVDLNDLTLDGGAGFDQFESAANVSGTETENNVESDSFGGTEHLDMVLAVLGALDDAGLKMEWLT